MISSILTPQIRGRDEVLPISQTPEDPRAKGSLVLLGLISGLWTEELAAGLSDFLARNFPGFSAVFNTSAEETAIAGAGSTSGSIDVGTGIELGEAGSGGAASEAEIEAALPEAGKTSVYVSVDENGVTQYVGITDNLEARAAAHSARRVLGLIQLQG
ncbi:hypothetical protein [Pseudomonas sp. NPDC088444]|uniref:hypothetical protein n=1 Tax=Pseudomonas sp. NPDC088444 TaxID=3364456 RepID=UPI00384ADD73